MGERYLTVKEAAKRVDVRTRTIENYITSGLVVHYLPGDRRRYVKEADLLVMFRAKPIASRGSKWARRALREETD